MSILIGQKLLENAQIQKFKCDILSNFQTLCRYRLEINVIFKDFQYDRSKQHICFWRSQKAAKKQSLQVFKDDSNLEKRTFQLFVLFCVMARCQLRYRGLQMPVSDSRIMRKKLSLRSHQHDKRPNSLQQAAMAAAPRCSYVRSALQLRVLYRAAHQTPVIYLHSIMQK